MTDNSNNLDVMFYQLILSMQASAMQHLGKVASQLTGKIERNLDAAKYSIDLLEMLQRKTDGNLTDDEKKMLDHVLYELRLNYVDEVNKGETPDETDEQKEPTATETTSETTPTQSASEPEDESAADKPAAE